MNFFEHQASARRQTGRLILFFILSVALTVLALNATMYIFARHLYPGVGSWLWHAWSRQVVIGTLMIIAGGSFIEYLRLRGGGHAVAQMLGARRVSFATTDARERQFINIIAEMAIASGVSAPTPYVMDREHGINAFVAGLTTDQAVVVVTAGALEAFERDELQAVIGHEFSHILNGDMRLNVQLLALLAGILALGQFGGVLMRMASETASTRSDRKGGAWPLFPVGLLVWLVGSIGLLFGRLIKAAISRQREFLADASSVQFTRNPDGLAGALLKIRNHTGFSWLINWHAESMSHMCFAETLGFSSWLATHPPLEKRIAVLGRHYLVRDRARQRERLRRTQTAAEVAAMQGFASREGSMDLAPISYVFGDEPVTVRAPGLAAAGPAALVAKAGTVNPRELASAQALYRRLPPGVQQALESCEGAHALMFALLAWQSTAPARVVENHLESKVPALKERVCNLWCLLEGLDNSFALPLTELAQPRLQMMDAVSLRELLARLQELAKLDRQLSTFEFALLMLLRKQLQPAAGVSPLRLAQCLPVVAVLVATLMRTGGMAGDRLEQGYLRLMRTLTSEPPLLPPPDLTSLAHLARHLTVLGGLPLADRKILLELAATAVLADAAVRLEEYELLRVVAALLDCPMPILEA
ncbi:MAG: protease [Moraxellaceae bacterium]|jgi:Zn-dependent protease with chaperone function|nr:protease [Moraxellaceae bacterium]